MMPPTLFFPGTSDFGEAEECTRRSVVLSLTLLVSGSSTFKSGQLKENQSAFLVTKGKFRHEWMQELESRRPGLFRSVCFYPVVSIPGLHWPPLSSTPVTSLDQERAFLPVRQKSNEHGSRGLDCLRAS